MGIILDVARSEPIDREEWAHQWIRNLIDAFKQAGDDPIAVLKLINELNGSTEELVAVLLVAVVKEEFLEEVAEFAELILTLRRKFAGVDVQALLAQQGLVPTGQGAQQGMYNPGAYGQTR